MVVFAVIFFLGHAILFVTGGHSATWGAEWGGFLSDLGLFGMAWTLIRKHNCEQHRCLRVGRHTTAAGHTVCRKHHPDGHLTAEDIHTAHYAALEADGASTE